MNSIWPSRPRNSSVPAVGSILLQPVEYRQSRLNGCAVVLREESDRDLMTPFDGTAVDRERFINGAGRVGDQ